MNGGSRSRKRWLALSTFIGLALAMGGSEKPAKAQELPGERLVYELEQAAGERPDPPIILSVAELAVQRAIDVIGYAASAGVRELQESEQRFDLDALNPAELLAEASTGLELRPDDAMLTDPDLAANLSEQLASLASVADIRILGGVMWNHPAIGYLTDKAQRRVYCSAALIDARTVLTAAHCFCNRRNNGQLDRPSRVVFGSARPGSMERQQANLLLDTLAMSSGCHPSHGNTLEYPRQGDVALIRMNKSLPFAAQRVSLASHSDAELLTEVALAGYGKLDLGLPTSPNQQWFAIVPVATVNCARPDDRDKLRCYPPADDHASPLEMVSLHRLDPAGQYVAADACPGDSGGPVLLASRNESDRTAGKVETRLPDDPIVIVGVMSRKAQGKSGCAGGQISTLITNTIINGLIHMHLGKL